MPSEERRGHWMRTIGGHKFYPEDPRPEDFRIEEIAHALSMICRFGGHTPVFYSVAEHSVRVCDAIWEARASLPVLLVEASGIALFDVVMEGLVHDGAESLLGDVVWPLKRSPGMSGYRLIERDAEACMRMAFRLPPKPSSIVKHFDLVLLATEKRDLLGSGSGDRHELDAAKAEGSLKDWHSDGVEPLREKIAPWGQEEAKRIFLHRYAWVSEMRSGA